MQVNKVQFYNLNKVEYSSNKKQNQIIYKTAPTQRDSFVKKSNPSFKGRNLFNSLIIAYLKNKAYKTSMDASHRPYLSIIPELSNILKPLEIKVSKNETINAFDINPHNSNKYIIFLHGFSQNITSNQELYKTLAQTDYGVIAIDYRGYGKTSISKHSTEKKLLEDVIATKKYLLSKGVSKIGLIGHSFGAYIAEKASHTDNFAFQIFISPMLSMDFWKTNVLKHPKKYARETSFIRYIPHFGKQYKKIFNITQNIKSNMTQTYIIHSKSDRYIKATDVNNFSSEIPNLMGFSLIPKGGHRMDKNKIDEITTILSKL